MVKDVAALNEGLDQVKGLSKKVMNRGTFGPDGWIPKAFEHNPIHPDEFKVPTNVNKRKKGTRRPKLDSDDKMIIVHTYLIDKVPAAQVAKWYRISQPYVSALVKKA